ncbi:MULTISPECIES: zf-HC2 domain-containing protein [Clostridium]|uniref:Putative zinc-finger domain-containing protein n=1 Tax=Clostridium senegalense TaxID=1465809 RepID=A0A6M0H6G4_9CLOT|nr:MULTISPECIES: zf-HC2 domain-containing protein [Clostridium]NEU05441.1 hypothetical protein [Clostridium senegalense]
MKCYDTGILQSYIDGELSPEMMKKVSNHLDKCKVCQSEFDKLLELNQWEIELRNQDIQRDPIDVEKAWNKLEYNLNNQNIISKIRGVFMNMNKSKLKKITTVTMAALTIMALPMAAKGVQSLFSTYVLEDSIVNETLVREDGTVVDGTKDGQFQTLDEKITDKDITVHLTDLYVSESRVSVNYRIEDKNGNLVPIEYDTKGLDLKDDGIKDGKQVDDPEYYLDKKEGTFSVLTFLQSEEGRSPFELFKDGNKLEIGVRELGEKTEGTITFVGFNPLEYPVNLDININKIGKVSGSWNGQIEINPNK